MEIEKNLINNSEETILNIFHYDFEGQKIENNVEFKKYKNAMIGKIGINAKLFKCKDDKILFYYDCSQHKSYEVQCPKCKKYICYFCSNYNRSVNSTCCATRKVYNILKVEGFVFMDDNNSDNISDYFLLVFIPFINLVYFIGCLHSGLFYKLKTWHTYKDFGYDNIDYEVAMRAAKDHNFLFFILICMDGGFSILLSFTLIIINIYVTILLILISIPFKLYPIKYIIGIEYSNHF